MCREVRGVLRGRGGSGSSLGDERGSTTVLTAVVIVVLMLLVGLGIQLGAAVSTRHRVAAAADLAALAAAARAIEGPAACERARWVVERMAATMTACRIVGWQAYVEATARPPGWAAVSGTANAHARAGPAEVPDDG